MTLSFFRLLFFAFLGIQILLLGSVSGQSRKDSLHQAWASPQNSDSLRIDAISKLIWEYYLFNNQDSAIILSRAHRRLAEMAEKPRSVNGAVRNIGIAHYYKGNYDSAEFYYLNAFEADSSIEFLDGMAAGCLNLGLLKADQGQFNKALDYYLRGLRIQERQDNQHGVASMLNNIGALHFNQQNPAEALEYFKQSLEVYRALEDSGGIAMGLNNVGLMLQGEKRYEESAKYHWESLSIRRKTNFKMGEFNSLENLGTIYLDRVQLDSARFYFGLAYSVAEEISNYSSMAMALLGAARVEMADKNYQEALQYAIDAYQISKSNEVEIRLKSELADCLYQVYKGLSMGDSALVMLEQYQQLKDSIQDDEGQKEILRKEYQYQAEKQEQEIALLNAEKDRREAQRNLFVGLSLAALILLVVGGYFIIKIRKQNHQIEIALEEKNVLLKEIHHRVKNNLQMISSLLGLHSRYTSDETASKALKESQGRVTSVSLIHQRLYSETNLTGVYMPEYVQELTEELLYAANANEIDVQLQIDEISLDVDTIIPLGLILNELITNSLKYGRKGANDELRVRLEENGGKLILAVSDNGDGFPIQFDSTETGSYGMKLIHSLASKLKADVKFENREAGGAQVILTIGKYKLG